MASGDSLLPVCLLPEKAVARAKDKAYEDLYKRLDSKEGENDIYRIAKARQRRKMDLRSVRFIKDEDGRSIVNEDAIRRRWKEYFFALFNGQRRGRTEDVDSIGGISRSIPWCLIFADDIVLVSDTPDRLNGRLEQWRKMLEDKGLRVSREKTEYMRCDFIQVNLRNDQKEERIEDDVTHRIQAGWLKWRAATGILCDKNVPLKLKEKFYRVAIRPAMLYGSECWPLTKVQANRMEVAEMRMLRHVKRRPQSTPVRRVETIVVDGVRRRGRPKLRWEDRLKTDLKELLFSEDMTSDRNSPLLKCTLPLVVVVAASEHNSLTVDV
ncbi:hypothetical protein Tco_0046544 [Tanacetum coccineum]